MNIHGIVNWPSFEVSWTDLQPAGIGKIVNGPSLGRKNIVSVETVHVESSYH